MTMKDNILKLLCILDSMTIKLPDEEMTAMDLKYWLMGYTDSLNAVKNEIESYSRSIGWMEEMGEQKN